MNCQTPNAEGKSAMSYAEAIPPSLFDLLGRSWSLGQPVRESRFSRAGETVAFRTDDGLALVAVPDPERPETRMRLAVDDGRRTIAPRRARPRPVARATGTAGPVAAKSSAGRATKAAPPPASPIAR